MRCSCFRNGAAALQGIPLNLIGTDELVAEAAFRRSRNKIVARTAGRNLVVDTGDVVYATIMDGVISVITTQAEGQTNYKTIEELQASLDPAVFWRAHRSYLVNINRIREVIPWFKSSYMLKMDDRKGSEIPVSRAQTKRLRELFRL